MAITIVQAPPNISSYYQSLNTPLWHVVTSSNSANTDFRFVFDVNILTTSLALIPIGRFKVSPDATARGVIDLSRVVRAGLVNYFTPDITSIPFHIDTDDIAVTYVVDYGEEYTTAGVTTVYPALTTDAYRAQNDYNPDILLDPLATYMPSLNKNGTWLTSRDITDIWMPRDPFTYAYLSFMNLTRTDYTVSVQEIDANNVPQGTASVTAALPMVFQLQVISLASGDLNALPYVTGPATPIVPASAGFRIRIGTSPWAYVRYFCEPKVLATALFFMNRFGAFDTYFFQGPTRRDLEVNTKTYQRLGAVTSTAPGDGPIIREYDVNTQVYADTTTIFNNKHNWTRKLSSGYVNDATHNWLWELVGSSQVYMYANGCYFPVTIKTQRWSEKFERFDKMYNLEIEITMNRQVYAQSR